MPLPLEELVHPTWVPVLKDEQSHLTELGEFLREETNAGRPWLPAGSHILRAFQQPLPQIRVLIMGQDPYPTPGHPVGLSFSVAPEVQPLPRSLTNIFKEMGTDLGVPRPGNGDLSLWSDQGVLLLNRVLTVQAGVAGSHRGKGWESITEAAIRGLVARKEPLVAILWGRDAQSLVSLMPDVAVIASAHPSPLSAERGFFGSRPFSRANNLLEQAGGKPIDWALPS